MTKTALITGVSGQDGAYLSQLLIENGYNVVGTVRSLNQKSFEKLKHLGIDKKIKIVEIDLLDLSSILRLLQDVKPIEIYNLAAQSSVGLSFEQPMGTFSFNTLSVINLLEAIRIANAEIKYYQASSSEMYGHVINLPITENSQMHPMSPYATSKAAAHWLTINYRESYGLFTCTGILFNHESILRGENFFTKKVIRSALEIANGTRKELRLGNLDIKRDFGFAPKYVEAMWKMMQADEPDDYIICSGKSIYLREVVEYIFHQLGVDKSLIITDESLMRPNEIEDIYGDSNKAKTKLDWHYDTSFFDILNNIIKEIVEEQA